mmetsp:Transcript_131236/g.318814  ORF Transcript_131236/g.318814 Transcript_131236/m.318814 type:complete len:99 (-) Transcript_131236:123-419(-)
MLTLLLLLSKQNVLYNLLIGVQLVSNVVSTTNLQLLYQVVILPVSNVLYVWFPTLLLLLKLCPVLIINSILCTPNVPLFIGMLVKVWKKVNFLKLVKI